MLLENLAHNRFISNDRKAMRYFTCLSTSFKFTQINAKSCDLAKYRRQLLTAAVTAMPKSIKLATTKITGMFAQKRNMRFALLPRELYMLIILTAAIR
jgi:hypothetical protein